MDVAHRGPRSSSPRPGSSRSPSARSPRSTTTSSRSTSRCGSSSSPSSWPTSRCPDGATSDSATRPRRVLRRARVASTTARTSCAAVARPPDEVAASCGWPRATTTWSTARGDLQTVAPGRAGLRAHDLLGRVEPGTAAAPGRSSSPTAGRRNARCRRCATRSSAALAEAMHTGWDDLVRLQREYLDDVLGAAPTWRSRARRACSRRFASGCSTCFRPGARNEGRAIPAKGLTGSGLRRPRVLGHRDVRAPDAHLLAAGGGARRAALAARDARARRSTARSSSASRAPPFPGGRSPARSARAIGRPAPPHSTSTPTSPTRPHRYCGATGGRGLRRRVRRSSCSSRPRGCGARSAITTPTAPSASTASPGPDEY